MNLGVADIKNRRCFAHGGRWADYLEEHGTMPLDFSANTSPLGMPGGAKVAAIAALQHADRYPDPHCRELRRALADHYALNKDEILVGNGAGDLIDRLALALRPRRALVTAPTFSEYRAAFERVGCYIEQHPLAEKNDFVVDEGILKRIDDTLDVLVLCEPNNPTGRTTEPALLERIACRCDQMGTFLLVDECFGDFLDEPAAHSMLPGIKAHRMLVLRAFTKFHGMAGLRLGWCACHDLDLLRAMAEAGQPWPVSVIAQEAGVAALADGDYARRLRTLIRAERAKLAEGLRSLGLRVVPGEANYLLFFDKTPQLTEHLANVGILVRDCANFAGLGPGWYRTAVRDAESNAILLNKLAATQAANELSR